MNNNTIANEVDKLTGDIEIEERDVKHHEEELAKGQRRLRALEHEKKTFEASLKDTEAN